MTAETVAIVLSLVVALSLAAPAIGALWRAVAARWRR